MVDQSHTREERNRIGLAISPKHVINRNKRRAIIFNEEKRKVRTFAC